MKRLPEMSKAEWTLMEGLWLRGRATATDLQKDLAESQGWAYSTVKTMLDRLVDKGYVKTRRVGNVYEYSPKVRRNGAVTRVVDDVIDRVLEGSVTPFIHQLLERRKPTADEVSKLRDLLEGYEDEEEGDS